MFCLRSNTATKDVEEYSPENTAQKSNAAQLTPAKLEQRVNELEGLLADRDVCARVSVCLVFAGRQDIVIPVYVVPFSAKSIFFLTRQAHLARVERDRADKRAEFIQVALQGCCLLSDHPSCIVLRVPSLFH